MARDLNDIIEEATVRNRVLGVTGLLLYGRIEAIVTASGQFVQWLEGPEDTVEALYDAISEDPRHTDLEVLGRGDLASGLEDAGPRLFSAWSMGLVRMSKLPATLDGFLRFSATWDRSDVGEASLAD